FYSNALDFGGLFLAVPGDPLDAHVGEVAAKTAIAFDEHGFNARVRRADRRREPAGPAADDKDIGFRKDRRQPRWFQNFFHGFPIVLPRTSISGGNCSTETDRL